jgi:hypothetical protein
MISSLTEHTRKCLRFEYLGRIEYDFEKSSVTGSWDHKDLVSVKKVFEKNSCLCTFNYLVFVLEKLEHIILGLRGSPVELHFILEHYAPKGEP